ncbi:phosphomannomutase/phosphoglucomutase [Candidatus Parcubacteria bacterium]|nr:MAG: phosphomannomutase/phosphoglucomutase [Candidatus Parcubacteria bacterium]
MSFPDHIFKAYDIRGLYPQELDEKMAYNMGRAYAEFMKKDTGKDDLKLVVCQDMRDSSIPLKKELVRGMLEQGVDIVDIGLASTPTFYFGVSFYGYDGGVQVTASHNPGEYNGFKIVRARAVPISGETGIHEIRDMVRGAQFDPVEKQGQIETREGVLEEQIAYALKHIDYKSIKPLKVVVDTGNGMGAPIIEELFKHLPCELDKMYFELDGSFPNHESNPFKEENNVDIQNRIRETGADLGIGLDGDGDRVFFFDETGRTIDPGIIRGILAQLVLRDHPGAAIGYDIRPGRITRDMIEEGGGKPFVTRVGHSLIKMKGIEMKAPFSGESSGHFFYNEPHGFFEMPAFIILNFLKEISQSGKTVSEYTAPLYRYSHSGEINFNVDDKEKVLQLLKEKFADSKINDLDGLSFEYEDYWFNVRPSNTESLLRLNLEAKTDEIMKEKVEEVTRVIES